MDKLPIKILNGTPGYINILDVLYSWRLVLETNKVLGASVVASFKYTSPAGVGTSLCELTDIEKKSYFVDTSLKLNALSTAFLRA